MSSRSCRVMMFDKLRFFLDPSEYSFLSRIIYLKDLRECGCRTAYSSDFNFISFQLSRATFYRCAKRLKKLGLIEIKQRGKFSDYILVEKSYNRLLDIINSTDDVNMLIQFSKREFILKGRSIDMITDDDICNLRNRSDPLYSS